MVRQNEDMLLDDIRLPITTRDDEVSILDLERVQRVVALHVPPRPSLEELRHDMAVKWAAGLVP